MTAAKSAPRWFWTNGADVVSAGVLIGLLRGHRDKPEVRLLGLRPISNGSHSSLLNQ